LLKVYGAPPTVLPLPDTVEAWPACTNEVFVRHLSALGYPPFGYIEPHPRPENPAALLLWALGSDTLEPRLFEGLPWILLAFADLDVAWLVREAKLQDLQNRLGFVVYLASEVARGSGATLGFAARAQPLATLLATLEPSRLAREDSSLGGMPSTPKIREHLRALRSPAAAHWNLLTLLRPEHLRYD
jgi:hypothetical protein